MSGPLIYLGIHSIKPGKIELARTASRGLSEFLEANHPRVAHFQIYLDEAASTLTVLQVHPDEDSLRMHLQLAGEKIAAAYEFLEGTTRIEIYGSPSDAMVQQVTRQAMGAPVEFRSAFAGFSRLSSAG